MEYPEIICYVKWEATYAYHADKEWIDGVICPERLNPETPQGEAIVRTQSEG